jgi:DNA-binding NarL/FixJ family response regulator
MSHQGDRNDPAAAGPAFPGKPARVLLADSHPIVRNGLERLIAQQKDMVCCATSETMEQTQCQVAKHRPDLVVLELRMRGVGGLEFITSLRKQFPEVPILALSSDAQPAQAESALRAGVQGFVDMWSASDQVLEAMRAVLSGQVYCRMQP